jgi:hypothetical protein
MAENKSTAAILSDQQTQQILAAPSSKIKQHFDHKTTSFSFAATGEKTFSPRIKKTTAATTAARQQDCTYL